METYNNRRTGTPNILSSDWTGLSSHLIAKFFPVNKQGFVLDEDTVEVHAPISDGNSEMTLNWQSPFEGAGPESKVPALSAMLQSGALTSVLQVASTTQLFDSEMIQNLLQKSADFLRSVEGRTGITKLNSTQVFAGMPPVKITLTLYFRAFKDPAIEVTKPMLQLKEWALPQELAADGLIAGATKNGTQQEIMKTIFPSKSPQLIGMRYGDMTWSPMVIESLSESFTSPRTDKGALQHCSVQMTLCTLAALDRRDIQKVYRY